MAQAGSGDRAGRSLHRAIAGVGKVPVLDATADGVKVYRRQGFVSQFDFDRWQGFIDGAANLMRAKLRRSLILTPSPTAHGATG
jgi:hypothetical protein